MNISAITTGENGSNVHAPSLTLRIENGARRDEKVLCVAGTVNYRTHRQLLHAATSLYQGGVRTLDLDLAACDGIQLSGLFALHSIGALFRGETPPDPEAGWAALRTMRARAEAMGMDSRVRYKNAQPRIATLLAGNGFSLSTSGAEG